MKDKIIQEKYMKDNKTKPVDLASNKKVLQFAVCGNEDVPQVPDMSEVKSNRGWVNYGKKNDFPIYLWDLYLRSAVLQSVINGTGDFVMGDGIRTNDGEDLPFIKKANNKGESLNDVLKRVITDYLIFDGFAIQVIFNKMGQIGELYWLDFRNCRTDEDETVIYYSKGWEKGNPHKIEYPRFDGSQNTGSCVFYFKGHKTRGVYPIPRYSGALNAIETSTEIARYHLTAIHNNFNGNLIINFNNGEPTDDVKKDIEKKIKNKFSGSENGGKFLVSFNDSKENGVEVVRLQDDNTDKKYEQLRKDTYKEIFIAFRCQPQLFGFLVEGSLFNKEEYNQAYDLYYKTVVQPIQNDIVSCLERIYGLDDKLSFIPFILNKEGDNESTITE